tara:strand:+ start:2031 stop:2501 length:471 start_codon:yes stop_codon:yes gene_type:complete
MNKKQIDIDKYEGHTENKWEWYEFGDGDWILCPLFDGVKANEDDMWWVDENGEHINDSQDIFNWDERILNLASDCMTGNRDPTCKDFVYCSHSNERLPRKQADMNLIQDAPLLLAEVKRLRRQIKVAQGVFEHLYDDELEDASWIRWFCNMEDEEE